MRRFSDDQMPSVSYRIHNFRSQRGDVPGPFHYCMFGLQLRSEIELPELRAVAPSGDPDVEILQGSIPCADRMAEGYLLGNDGAGFVIDDVAGFWISDGQRIVIEPQPGVAGSNVRLYLLGSAMGVLLHQRGLLPLHANCVEIDGQGVAFLGRSGAGKSTLAAAFYDRGFRVVADDVCVIDFDDSGQALVTQGIPRLRLWEEALAVGSRNAIDYQLSYAGDEQYRKFDVPVGVVNIRLPLAAIYRLSDGTGPGFRKLEGTAAAETVFANTYRGSYLRAVGDQIAHWSLSTRLLGAVPVFDFSRPRGLDRIAADLDLVIAHVREQVSQAGRNRIVSPKFSTD